MFDVFLSNFCVGSSGSSRKEAIALLINEDITTPFSSIINSKEASTQ